MRQRTPSSLFHSHPISTPYGSTLNHRGIDANVGVVLRGCRTENAGVLGKITLGERRHDTAGTGAGNAKKHLISNGKRTPDPVVLDKTPMPACHLHHDIGTKSPDLEAPLGIALPQSIDGRRLQYMDDGVAKGARSRIVYP